MGMIRKPHCLMLEQGVAGEVRFVNRLFLLPHLNDIPVIKSTNVIMLRRDTSIFISWKTRIA
jgi:hypothetical protein